VPKHRVLIVEDDRISPRLIKHALERVADAEPRSSRAATPR